MGKESDLLFIGKGRETNARAFGLSQFIKLIFKELGLKELFFPDFSGKIVLLYLENRASEDSVVLENAAFQIQGDKIFLVGRIAEGTTPNDWASGVDTAVSCDSIEQYLVFDSLQEYMDRVARSYTEENYH